MFTTFELRDHRLTLIHPNWSTEFLPVSETDISMLQQCAAEYLQALKGLGIEKFPDIGTKLAEWLNRTGWLARLLSEIQPIWTVVFKVPLEATEAELTFLNAPWELLMWQHRYLAVDFNVQFNPIRQLGTPTATLEPSPHRLNLVFMAAAPENVTALSYEKEEAGILHATRDLGLDLFVEETGTLAELTAQVSRYQPDVLHISCHGGFDDENHPVLCLEDEEGAQAMTQARDWLKNHSLRQIKLAFISACHTAQPAPTLTDSFATQLLKAGIPAVLGWGSSVYDGEAMQFAKYFYHSLSQNSLCIEAMAEARLNLFYPPRDAEFPLSFHWHLARLFLGHSRVERLNSGDEPRRWLDDEFGAQAFLDKKQQVPVARAAEFVGRRRALQTIIRELRNPKHAGVLIHGMGRQGKSSLAARVARRLIEHEPVVVFGHYSAVDILQAFRGFDPEFNKIVREYESQVRENPSLLSDALLLLLQGKTKPILLIIDDLEQILMPPPQPEQLHTVRTEEQVPLRILISTFQRQRGRTKSRLLLTSRYRFFLADEHGNNLTEKLLQWHLAPMNDNERYKQLEQKRLLLDATQKIKVRQDKLEERCLAVASGNPGLQNQLYVLIRENPQVAERTLEEVAQWLNGTEAQIADEKTRDLLESLVLNELYRLLTPHGQEILQLSQDFVMPLPFVALQAWAGKETVTALLNLGLWDSYRDSSTARPTEKVNAALLNRLARRLCRDLTAEQRTQLAQQLLPPLWQQWQTAERSDQADYQLTRLAVRIAETTVLAEVAECGIFWAWDNIATGEVGKLGLEVIAQLEQANLNPSPLLLYYTIESCRLTDKIDEALQLCQKSLVNVHLKEEYTQAIAYESFANLLQTCGRSHEALWIRQQKQIPIYTLVGNERFKAVAMSQISSIFQTQGLLYEALQILKMDVLPIFENYGDTRNLLITQVDISVLLMQLSPPRRAEANQLLCQALRAAEKMRIPEAGQIEKWLQYFEMQC